MRWCGQDWTTPAGPCSGPSTGLLHLHLFTALPTLDAQPFRLLLCRRMHLPLPLSTRTCRCGRQLDMFRHHRAACAVAGVLGRRGYPLECAAAQDAVDGRMLTGFPWGMEPSWPSTPPWSPLCTATEAPGGGLQTMTVLHWKSPGAERSARTQNSLGKGVGGRWSEEPATYSQPWPRRVLSLLHEFCRTGSKPRGFVGGAQCSRALQHGLSQCLCSTADQCQALGETPVCARGLAGMHVLAPDVFFCQFGSVYPTLMILLLCALTSFYSVHFSEPSVGIRSCPAF